MASYLQAAADLVNGAPSVPELAGGEIVDVEANADVIEHFTTILDIVRGWSAAHDDEDLLFIASEISMALRILRDGLPTGRKVLVPLGTRLPGTQCVVLVLVLYGWGVRTGREADARRAVEVVLRQARGASLAEAVLRPPARGEGLVYRAPAAASEWLEAHSTATQRLPSGRSLLELLNMVSAPPPGGVAEEKHAMAQRIVRRASVVYAHFGEARIDRFAGDPEDVFSALQWAVRLKNTETVEELAEAKAEYRAWARGRWAYPVEFALNPAKPREVLEALTESYNV